MMLQDFTLAAVLFAVVLVFVAEEQQEEADHDRAALIGGSVAALNDAVEAYVKAHYGSLELCLGSGTMAKGGTGSTFTPARMSPWVPVPLYYVADVTRRANYLVELGMADTAHWCQDGPFSIVPAGHTHAAPPSLQETGFLPSFLARTDAVTAAGEPQRWLRNRLDFRVMLRLVDVGPEDDAVPVPAVQGIIVGRTLPGDALPAQVVRDAVYLSGSAASGYVTGTAEVGGAPPREVVGVGGGWSFDVCVRIASPSPADPVVGTPPSPRPRVPGGCAPGYSDVGELGVYFRGGAGDGPLWRALFPGAEDRAEYASGSAYPNTSLPRGRLVSFVSSARSRVLDAVLYRQDIGVPGTGQMERDLDMGGFAVVQAAAITGVSIDDDPEIEHGVQIVGPPPGAHCSDDLSFAGTDCDQRNQPTRVFGDLHVTGNLLVGGVYPDDFKPALMAPAQVGLGARGALPATATRPAMPARPATPAGVVEAHGGRVHVATGQSTLGANPRRRPDGLNPHGSLYIEGRGYVEEDVRLGSSLGVGHRYGGTHDAPAIAYATPEPILGPYDELYGGTVTTVGTEPRGHVDIRGELYVQNDVRLARQLGVGHVRTDVGVANTDRDDILSPDAAEFVAASTEDVTAAGRPGGAERAGHLHVRGETYIEEDVRMLRNLGLGHMRQDVGRLPANRDEILGGRLTRLQAKDADPRAAPLRTGRSRAGHLHVRGETYGERDVRFARNLGLGHVRMTSGTAGPGGDVGTRDDILGAEDGDRQARRMGAAAFRRPVVAVTQPADRMGHLHVRGEGYVEESVRVLRDLGVGHARTGVGALPAQRDDILGTGTAAALGATKDGAVGTVLRTHAHRSGDVHVRGETYMEEDVRVLRDFGVGHARVAVGSAPTARDEILGTGEGAALGASKVGPVGTVLRSGAHRSGDVHVRGEGYVEESVRVLRDLGVGHFRRETGALPAHRDEILGATRPGMAAKTGVPGSAMRTGAHRSGELHVRGETYLEEDVRIYRDLGVGLTRTRVGNTTVERDDILGGAVPALPPKNATAAAVALRGAAGEGGHLHVAQEAYVEEDLRVRKALGVGHERSARGTATTEGTRDDILGRLWSPNSRGDLGDVDVRGELFVRRDARVARNVGIGLERTAMGTGVNSIDGRDDILASGTGRYSVAGAASADVERGHLHVQDSAYVREEARVGGGLGVGHNIGDGIPARGGGGAGVPVLDVANSDPRGDDARVFIHDPANLWWHQDPQSRNNRAGTWRGSLAGALPAYSMYEVEHADRRSGSHAAGDPPTEPVGWRNNFAVPATECSYTLVPAGIAKVEHPTFRYTISIQSGPPSVPGVPGGSDATWPPASISFDVPEPLLGWELAGPGPDAGRDTAPPHRVSGARVPSQTRFYTLRGCNLRNARAVYATP